MLSGSYWSKFESGNGGSLVFLGVERNWSDVEYSGGSSSKTREIDQSRFPQSRVK